MQFKIFKKENLIQGVSDVSFGSMVGEETREVQFLESLGHRGVKSANIVWPQQVFSARVHVCKKRDSGKIVKNVDGLLSNGKGQILAVLSADCVPILLYDKNKKAVGTLHGSRKSLTSGIIKNAMKKLRENYHSQPKDILVGIGPHIRICHYWLKEKSYQELRKTFFKKYFEKRKTKVYFDLTKLVFEQLLAGGIKKENIEDCKICTFCQYKKYFSMRKKEENPTVYPIRNKTSNGASKDNKIGFGGFIGRGVRGNRG